MDNPELYIEALIFSSEQSIRIEEIMYCIQSAFEHDFTRDEIMSSLDNIQRKYRDDNLAIELVNMANGYQFLTKKKLPFCYQFIAIAAFKEKVKRCRPRNPGYYSV